MDIKISNIVGFNINRYIKERGGVNLNKNELQTVFELCASQLINSVKERCATDIQNINNPYPESVFPMTTKDYVKAIPDEHKRTAISGYCGRLFWDLAINEAVRILREN